ESCLVSRWPHHRLLLLTRCEAARQSIQGFCRRIRRGPSSDGKRSNTARHLVASERKVPGVRPANLAAAMGPYDPPARDQRLGLDRGNANTVAEQDHPAPRGRVFSRWTLARVYVE